MYNILKYVANLIIPKKLIFNFETRIRYFIYIFHKGSTYQCNICEKGLSSFINIKENDKLCPYCGSLSRDRRLWQLINNNYLTNGIKVLDFSPSRSLYRRFKKLKNLKYFSTDISGDFIADYCFDITSLKLEDNSFNLIICYHILEHVIDDYLAMKEIYRVLASDGICIIQTPFKEGEIYENNQIISEDQRLIHFGQKDHVRIYSLSGLEKRLNEVGFKVKILNFECDSNNVHGYKTKENVFICTK